MKRFEHEFEKSFEIPKKELFKLFQEDVLEQDSSVKIQQKWCYSGEADGVSYSARIRATKSTNSGIPYGYEHTVKYYLTNDKRLEMNSKITSEEYKIIFDLYPNGKVVNKTRLLFHDKWNPLKYSADIFGDKENAIIEIEFSNQDTMDTWVPPEWLQPYAGGNK